MMQRKQANAVTQFIQRRYYKPAKILT